jgi:hypothetical protein
MPYVLQIVITLLRLAAYFTHEMPLRKLTPMAELLLVLVSLYHYTGLYVMLPGH